MRDGNEIVSSTASSEEEMYSTSSANSYDSDHDAIEVDGIDYSGPDAEAMMRAQIEEALVRCGITGRTLALATLKIEALFHRTVIAAAAEGLASVLAELGNSPTAWAIRRRLTHDTRSIRSVARENGFSDEGLRRAERRLNAALEE